MNDAARQLFNALPSDGAKISEKSIKESTSLSVTQIKESKKWLKDNGLTETYRGRGGYVSRVEGKAFPESVVKSTVEERLAVAREVKKERSLSRNKTANAHESIRNYVRSEVSEYADVEDRDFDFNIVGEDEYLVVVYKNGFGKKYIVHLDDAKGF